MDAKQLAFRKLFPGLNLDTPVTAQNWKDLHALRGSLRKGCEDVLEKIDKRGDDATQTEIDALDIAETALRTIQEEMDFREKLGDKGPRNVRLGGGKEKKNIGTGEFRSGEPGLRYDAMFGAGEGMGPYEDREHFWQCVLTNQIPETRTMLASVGASGGYTVPAEMARDIYNAALEEATFLPYVRTFRMTTGTLAVPAWDSETRSEGGIAGFQGQWMPEDGTFTPVTPKMRIINLAAKKLGVYIDVSRECISDSLTLSQQLGPTMTRNLGYMLDAALYDGTGVGQPLGILRSPARIEVARSVANQIAWDDVKDMYVRLHPAFLRNARWFVSPSALAQLLDLADAGNNNLFVQSAGPSIPPTLLGRPVMINEHSKALGTTGDFIFADLTQYGYGLRQEIIVESTNAAQWTRDLMSFRAIVRCDGHCLMDTAITPVSGDSLSSIVVLA